MGYQSLEFGTNLHLKLRKQRIDTIVDNGLVGVPKNQRQEV